MTAMGTNGKTFIDIYGGVNATTTAGSSGGFADPNLRIGNLSGLGAVEGNTPQGWGIYTTNGYFKGVVVSSAGNIGGWNLTTDSIWKNNQNFGNANGMYFGASGISLGSTFKVTNAGVLTATAGTIAGWRIESSYLASGTATSPAANVLLLSPAGTSSSYTVAGQAKTGWMITAGTSFGVNKDGGIYATAGKIGGFDIGTSSIKNTKTSYSETTYDGIWVGTDGIGLGKGLFYVTNAGALTAKSGSIAGWSFNASSLYKTNATPGYSAATMVISTGTASTKNIGGGGTTSKTWMISAGTGFGVTTAGALYCNDAHISGEITATSGTIGGASITDGTLTVPAAQVNGELTAATINGSKITANTITADQIAASAITADELAANAVTSAKIKAGEVKADNIASNAVTADKLDATTINASNKLTVGAMTIDTQTSIENKNIYDNKFYRYKKDITVYGDSNKYYPVYFKNSSSIYTQNDTHRISIYRGYSQQAPSDWYTSTHKGGLTLNIKWNYGGWGGATYNCEITEFTELYSTMVGDVQVAVGSGMTSAIFLRGGGTTGALYHIYCDVPLDVTHYNGTFPAIGNNENVGTDYMYTGDYHWKYATPLTTPNTIHIKGLIAKNTAANYITDIDSNKGITIKPSDSSGNDYLQINSSAITTYRNNIDVMSLGDSSFRMGTASGKHTTVDSNGLHVWIGSESTAANEVGLFSSTARIGAPASSRFLLNADSLQAYNSSNVKYFEVSASGLSFGGNAVAKASDIPTTVAELTDSGSYATNTALTNATGWSVIINISAIDYVANTATLYATVYKDGAVKTSGFTLQWYKTVTTTSTTTTAISGETSSTLSVTSTMGLDASYTCVVN